MERDNLYSRYDGRGLPSLEYVIPVLFKGLLVIVTVALWICIGILALYLIMYSIKLLGGR